MKKQFFLLLAIFALTLSGCGYEFVKTEPEKVAEVESKNVEVVEALDTLSIFNTKGELLDRVLIKPEYSVSDGALFFTDNVGVSYTLINTPLLIKKSK